MCLSRFRCKCKFAGIEMISKPKFPFFSSSGALVSVMDLFFETFPAILAVSRVTCNPELPIASRKLMKPWDAQHPWKSAKFKIKCEVNTMFFPFSFFHHLFKLLWNKPNNFAMSSFFSGSQPTHSYLVSLILSSWERTVLGVRFDTSETQCV